MANSALIDDLRKQFAENPRRVFARLANEYRKRGELDSAIEICRSHVPLQPGYISGHIVLGQALYDSGSLDEARATFETALTLDPENLIALRHMGDIARASGDVTRARAWYRQLLEIDPQNEDVAGQLDSLGADGRGPGDEGTVPPDEASAWGEVSPTAVELAGDVTLTDAPVAGLELLDISESREATSALDFDDVASEELTATAESGGPVEGLEVSDVFDGSTSGAAPVEMVEIDDLEREAPESAFDDVIDLEPASRAAPPLYPPDPYGTSVSHDMDAPAGPSAFATETMAELYLQQGLPERALAIYRGLVARRPDDASLRERIAELEEASVAIPAPAAPSGKSSRTAREFFGVLAYRTAPRGVSASGSAPELFPSDGARVSAEDEGAATALAQAFQTADGGDGVGFASALLGASAPKEDGVEADADATSFHAAENVARIGAAGGEVSMLEDSTDDGDGRVGSIDAVEPGLDLEATDSASASSTSDRSAAPVESNPSRPGREASDALSLDDVFRDSSSRGDSRREPGVSFDEFFARRRNGVAPESSNGTGAADDEEASINGNRATDDAPQDLELFHAWLDGLKG